MNTLGFNDWEEEEEDTPIHPTGKITEELLTEKYKASQLKIVRTSVDYSTDQLYRMIAEGEINVSPLYQRRNRWDIKKKSRLIESLFLNIPIPPLYLYEFNYGNYEVMDGRQRLEALQEFLNGSLRLSGLEYWSEVQGLTYKQLPSILQQAIRRRTIGSIILLAESAHQIGNDNDVRMILFERLNTGGVKLNPQELRNALYQGPFNSLIIELAATPLFRNCWDIPIEDEDRLLNNAMYSSMTDCDLVLRFFAIREMINGERTGSLRALLDGCARDNQHLSRSSIKEYRYLFLESLRVASELFRDFVFRLPNTMRLSKSVYDASMVAISLQLGRQTVGTQKALQRLREVTNNHEINGLFESGIDQGKLMGSIDYATIVGRGNTNQSIRDRVELMTNIIFRD